MGPFAQAVYQGREGRSDAHVDLRTTREQRKGGWENKRSEREKDNKSEEGGRTPEKDRETRGIVGE